jgi:hypothetical protein
VAAQTETEAVPRIPPKTTDKMLDLKDLVAKEVAEVVDEGEVNRETPHNPQEQSPLKHRRMAVLGGHLEAASVLA